MAARQKCSVYEGARIKVMMFQINWKLKAIIYRKLFKSKGYEIFEIHGNYGENPGYISKEFDLDNKETFMLWGYFLLKQ